MSTYYCDYEGGNNANDGLSFAQRWKDLTNGATAARIAPGDTVRVMASPDPTSLGQVAAWTNGPLPETLVPTSSTNATPIVVTKASHGLATGDTVLITGHTVNTRANGIWNVTVSGDTFTLLNADGSNSAGNGTGGATGTFRKFNNAAVTLTSAVTANIASFGNRGVQANWTASADVTNTIISTDYKEGGECQQIAVGAAFTTGLAAYYPTGTLDLSGYQQVSFWIKQTAGTLGAASSCSLKLCSDTLGATPVNTIDIPALGSLSQWSPITVDTSGALGASIKSIALYVNTDNGAQTFLLDNIIACKASSAADSLSLTSRISKNTGTEGWFCIQSINGTRILLDRDTNCIPTSTPQRGYSGTTETITTYKDETIKTDMAALASTSVQSIMDSGTLGNLITFSGGWNRTDMSTQTGTTVFDGQNGRGYGLSITGKAYTAIESISLCRYSTGIIYDTNNARFNTFISQDLNNNASVGIFYSNAINNSYVINNINNNLFYGIYFLNAALVNGLVINSKSNAINGVQIVASCNTNHDITNGNNNGNYAINFTSGSSNNNLTIGNSTGNDSGSIGMAAQGGENYLKNSVLNSSVKVSGFVSFSDSYIWSTNENSNTDTHYGYTDGGLISSDAVFFRTSDMSWKLAPTSTNRDSNYPLGLKIGTVALEANVPLTFSCWMFRDNAGLTGRLICYKDQLTGITVDVSSSMVGIAGAWEQLSVTVTATQKGVVEFYAECWGGTTYNLWVDDPGIV